ncbi:hypothetical protein [Embleya sp. NPDC001921]
MKAPDLLVRMSFSYMSVGSAVMKGCGRPTERKWVLMKKARQTAARALVAGATVLALTPMMQGTAHAGAYCHTPSQYAWIYERMDTTSEIIDRLYKGVTVEATSSGSGWYAVSRVDTHVRLGYMPTYSLVCNGG